MVIQSKLRVNIQLYRLWLDAGIDERLCSVYQTRLASGYTIGNPEKYRFLRDLVPLERGMRTAFTYHFCGGD